VRLDATEHAFDVRRDRAVAAPQLMPPEQPQIAGLRDRVLWNRWSIVGIRQTLGLVREQRAELDLAEAGEREVRSRARSGHRAQAAKILYPIRTNLPIGDFRQPEACGRL
jgi:hypothetical protein